MLDRLRCSSAGGRLALTLQPTGLSFIRRGVGSSDLLLVPAGRLVRLLPRGQTFFGRGLAGQAAPRLQLGCRAGPCFRTPFNDARIDEDLLELDLDLLVSVGRLRQSRRALEDRGD